MTGSQHVIMWMIDIIIREIEIGDDWKSACDNVDDQQTSEK